MHGDVSGDYDAGKTSADVARMFLFIQDILSLPQLFFPLFLDKRCKKNPFFHADQPKNATKISQSQNEICTLIKAAKLTKESKKKERSL